MRFSNYSIFSSDFLNFGLDAAIRHTLELGLDSVEHIEDSRPDCKKRKLACVGDARNMRRALDENGLGVSCYSVGARLYGDNADAYVDNLFRDIEYAAIIGSPFVHHTLTSGCDVNSIKLTSVEMAYAVADRAERVAKRCNEYGMVCLYEPQGYFINGVSGVGTLLNEMRARGCRVGVCGDVGNSVAVDCMPINIFSTFKDDIRHIHIKDRRYGVDEDAFIVSKSGKIISKVRFGEGNIGVLEALSLLSDYDGVFSLEFVDSADEVRRTVELIKKIYNK